MFPAEGGGGGGRSATCRGRRGKGSRRLDEKTQFAAWRKKRKGGRAYLCREKKGRENEDVMAL